jgi:hypothetical protein
MHLTNFDLFRLIWLASIIIIIIIIIHAALHLQQAEALQIR